MIKFNKLKECHLEKVLGWRTQSEINRFMSTDLEYNLEKQKAWSVFYERSFKF